MNRVLVVAACMLYGALGVAAAVTGLSEHRQRCGYSMDGEPIAALLTTLAWPAGFVIGGFKYLFDVSDPRPYLCVKGKP